MSVLVTAEVRGQTAQGYDGLVLHSTHATEDGWRVIEVWESKAQSDTFFSTFVAPNLPRGIRPKRSVQPLHNVVLPIDAYAGVSA
jgi:hypothetical protein